MVKEYLKGVQYLFLCLAVLLCCTEYAQALSMKPSTAYRVHITDIESGTWPERKNIPEDGVYFRFFEWQDLYNFSEDGADSGTGGSVMSCASEKDAERNICPDYLITSDNPHVSFIRDKESFSIRMLHNDLEARLRDVGFLGRRVKGIIDEFTVTITGGSIKDPIKVKGEIVYDGREVIPGENFYTNDIFSISGEQEEVNFPIVRASDALALVKKNGVADIAERWAKRYGPDAVELEIDQVYLDYTVERDSPLSHGPFYRDILPAQFLKTVQDQKLPENRYFWRVRLIGRKLSADEAVTISGFGNVYDILFTCHSYFNQDGNFIPAALYSGQFVSSGLFFCTDEMEQNLSIIREDILWPLTALIFGGTILFVYILRTRRR